MRVMRILMLALVAGSPGLSGNAAARPTLLTATLQAQGGDKKFQDLVKIEFVKEEYVFTAAELAKEVKIDYRILVAQDMAGVIALPTGPSNYTPAGPSGLHPCERIEGNGNVYCLLDFGLAPPAKEVARDIKKGTFLHSFKWDGRNWTGPSDFGNPKGKPFPPGTYTLSVTLHGKLMTDQGKVPYQLVKTAKVTIK